MSAFAVAPSPVILDVKKDVNVTIVETGTLTPPKSRDGETEEPVVNVFSSFENSYIPPPALFKPKVHPNEPAATAEVDAYFIKHWPFKDAKAIERFKKAGFTYVTCCYYPEADNDRIVFASKLLTVLFLIDDLLEEMSFDDGREYNARLMPIARGDVLPNRSDAAEFITYDLWEEMRACDRELADEILEPVFVFMRAQTDPQRKNAMGLGSYLLYRERDVGKALLSALGRFAMKLHLSPEELESVKEVDLNCSKHISVVNDIYSWDKEVRQSQDCTEEGSVLCSSVQVISQECNVDFEAAKRILWSMCREWERIHQQMVNKRAGMREDLAKYCLGLEYQMSGNELWSQGTQRYINFEALM